MSLGLENKENGTKEATATAAPWSFQSKRGCSTSCSGTLPELDLPAWVFSSALRVQTASTRELTAPLLENPRPTSPRWNFPDYNHFQRQPQDLAAGMLQGWLYPDTAEALLPHAAGKEDKLAFMNILNSNIT